MKIHIETPEGTITYHDKCGTWTQPTNRHTQCICSPGTDCCCTCRVGTPLTILPTPQRTTNPHDHSACLEK